MAERATLDGYWLPEISGLSLEFEERTFGPSRVPVRVPLLAPESLREVLIGLRSNRAQSLAGLPLTEILRGIEAAASSLTRPGESGYAELLQVLPELTGYSTRMIEIGLQRMGANWTADALAAALESEFGALGVLDGFQPRSSGGFYRAYGQPLTVHVFSGNIPGVSVDSLIRALCVKSACFGKTAAGEPYFAVCFARALAEHLPQAADCLAVTYWPGGAEDLEEVAFSEAGAVIGYGSDETVARIAGCVPPSVRFIGYPNRFGAAVVAASALDAPAVTKLARGAALDVVTFDQQGCVSPHAIYVQSGGVVGPLEFARELAGALEELALEIPRGSIAPGESSLIHQLRGQAEMRGATVLASAEGTGWTVIVEDRVEFEPSPLNRVIHVRPIDDLSLAIAALERVGAHLQTVAIAAEGEELMDLAAKLGAAGATRLVRVGEAAWPSAHWHHDGRFQFLDLVRFVDLDAGDR